MIYRFCHENSLFWSAKNPDNPLFVPTPLETHAVHVQRFRTKFLLVSEEIIQKAKLNNYWNLTFFIIKNKLCLRKRVEINHEQSWNVLIFEIQYKYDIFQFISWSIMMRFEHISSEMSLFQCLICWWTFSIPTAIFVDKIHCLLLFRRGDLKNGTSRYNIWSTACNVFAFFSPICIISYPPIKPVKSGKDVSSCQNWSFSLADSKLEKRKQKRYMLYIWYKI